MWRWTIAYVLLLVTTSSSAFQTNSNGFLADEIPLEVSTIMPSRILLDKVVRVYGEQALTVVFSRPVIALGSDFGFENLPSELVPFTLDPAIPGRGRWVTTFIYRFDTEGPFATDLDIDFRWNVDLQTYDGVPLTLETNKTAVLRTQGLSMSLASVSSVMAQEATDDNWSAYSGTREDILPEVPPDGILRLSFNAPVSLAALQKNLKVRDLTNRKTTDITSVVTACRPARRVASDESRCAEVTLDGNLAMGIRYRLALKAGVDYGTASGPLRDAVSVQFGGLKDFSIPFYRGIISVSTPFLNLYLPHGLAQGTDLGDIPISITDSKKRSLSFNFTQISKSILLISAPLTPRERYTISVQASNAIQDGFGLPLKSSKAKLEAESVSGQFLGLTPPGSPSYAVFEANEDWGRLAVSFAKGLERDDRDLCKRGSILDIWQVNQPISALPLFTDSSRSFERFLGPPIDSLVSKRVDPVATLASLELDPFLERSGVIATQYCRFNRYYERFSFHPAIFVETTFQAVVVSSRPTSGSDPQAAIWVTSMVSGKPVKGAKVLLLTNYTGGVDNITLLGKGKTDKSGIALIPASYTRQSIMAVVNVGSNFFYIPDVRIRQPRRIVHDDEDAFIILDRALLRPGETLHVKGYVMERSSTGFVPAMGLSNTTLRVSPAVNGTYEFPVDLDGEFGSYEAMIEVPEEADLVRHNIRFVANKGEERYYRSFGKSASFTVGDPRLPTIELTIDTPFFSRPDEEIKFNVQVTSFIGLAVGGSNVTVEWSISDSRRGEDEEPLEGEVVVITDDDGSAKGVIDLPQFEVPPSLGTVVVLKFQLVGPTSELIEESARVRIEAADLSVSLRRTVNTDIPRQQFGAGLTVTDLRGDQLNANNSVYSATISLIKIPEDMEESTSSIPRSSDQSFDGKVVASCDYDVESEEYCDFAIPEIGHFVLEGCVQQEEVQLCRRLIFGKDDDYWERRPLRRFLPVGFVDLTPDPLRIGDDKELLVENPYQSAYILISWGTINRIEREVQPLKQGRQTVAVKVPEFCEFDCELSLVLAVPRQTEGLASNMTVPVSLTFDTAMPHTVTYRSGIEVIPTRPTDISVDISFPDSMVDDDSPVIAPGESTAIEVQLDRNERTEVTLIAVDRAVLDLVPYPLQNITNDFLIDLATSFRITTINRNLVAPGAIQALIANFMSRKEIDPWFQLAYRLDDSFRIDQSLEEYIDHQRRYITISGGGSWGRGTSVAPGARTTFAPRAKGTTVAETTTTTTAPAIDVRSTASALSLEQSVRLESEFQTTPLFITEVSGNGVLRVNFTAPSNLGTFVIRAYAASGTGLFGSAETSVIVRRELSLTPSVPRFARVGDVFEAGAVVTASGSTIVPITLTAEAEGPLEFLGSDSLTVEVGGDGQEEARFLVRATAVGMANFTLFADDGEGNTDALQLEIPIEGLQEAVTVGTSFVVQGDDLGEFTEGLALPAAVPGSGDIAITAGVGRQPAVFAIADQVLNNNPDFECPVSAGVVVASAALAGIVNPYSPWNPDPEVVSPALVEEINLIVPRFREAVELLAVGGKFTTTRLGLRCTLPCPDISFRQERASIYQNQIGVFLVNLAEETLRNHELEEVRSVAEALFEARNVWRGVLAAELEEQAIEVRGRFNRSISLYTVAEALAALGPDWTPETTDQTIINDLSLDRLSRGFDDLGIQSQAYYILTRLAQTNGSAHPDVPRALERWTDLLRITGRTAYISAFPGSSAPASNLANSLVFLAFTRAGEEGQLIPRLGSYIAAPISDNYGFAFFGTYAQAITMQALVEFDVSRGSAQPNLEFEARSGNTTILEASFTNSTAPVASASVSWDDLSSSPDPIEVSAVGEGEAFVAITLNFIPAEILPFPSYRGIYVERSIQLEDTEEGDGPGLAVVPRGEVVTVKVQFLTPDELDETVIRVLMPAGLEPIDPNISPSSSRRFCPIPYFRYFFVFYRRCPAQQTRPSVVSITYSSVRPGTSSVTFRAVASTVGNYTLPPTRVVVSDQPEVMGLSSGGRFEVCAGPNCQPEFLEPSPAPVDCVDGCNNSGSCNLSDGSCLCFSGFTGPACETEVVV